MKISEETLLAYVDNELDEATRAEIDAAIAADPELARRVEQQRSLRKLLGAAYDPVLDEPVPARLLAATKPRSGIGAKVVELAAARKRRRSTDRGAWGWAQWGGMAACLVLGLFVGRSGLPGEEIATQGGQLVARGTLAQALSTQLARSQATDAPVKVGTSFLSRGDEYCRSFTLARGRTGGLACRHGDDWQVRVLAQDSSAAPAGGDLRMASSALPPAVLRTIDEQIKGGALDAQAEQAALQRGWRR